MKLLALMLVVCVMGIVVHSASTPSYQSGCFFNIQKDSKGVWWIVDPNGDVFWSRGIDVMNPTGDTDAKTGRNKYKETIASKYADNWAWADAQVERALRWKINTFGAWTSGWLQDQNMPYTVTLNFLADWAKINCAGCRVPDLFDDGFVTNSKVIVRNEVFPHIGDPYLLGYFLDNEIFLGPDWHTKTPLLSYYLKFATTSAGYKQAISYVKSVHNTVAKVKSAWNVSISSYDDLRTVNITLSDTYVAEANGFDYKVAVRFFDISCKAIRSVDVDHMILGTKFNGFPNKEAIRADADYGSDIQSLDWYRVPKAAYDEFDTFYAIGKKPMLIGEFAYRGNDTGLPNSKGAGIIVATQAQRAVQYANFIRNVSKMPFMVGAHWFQFVDQPVNGRWSDGENCNYGVVNELDQEYTPLTTMMTNVNGNLEGLHGSTKTMSKKCSPRTICPNNCNGKGCCDATTKRCICHTHYSGGDCSIQDGYFNNYLDLDFLTYAKYSDFWTTPVGFWYRYSYFTADTHSLTDSGMQLRVSTVGCPGNCGGVPSAASGMESVQEWKSGWLNITAKVSNVRGTLFVVRWINEDFHDVEDGFEMRVNGTHSEVWNIVNDVFTRIQVFTLAFDPSTSYHTYALFWGSNHNVRYAIDGQQQFSLTRKHDANKGHIKIYHAATTTLPSGTTEASAYVRQVIFKTEKGSKDATCSS